MSENILIIEDDIALLETLVYNLKRQGYETETSRDGYDAVEKARNVNPDLIILDIMLPGLDGFEVCRILRKELNVPIIILTARDDEIDRIIGLEIGADDYLTKPFSMRELLARIKAHLRRIRLIREEYATESTVEHDILTFGNLKLNKSRREILLDDAPIYLKPKEFDLLYFLAQHRGQVMTRELLLERVWGWEFIGGSRTVDVHIRWLREKLETNPSEPIRIVTIRGFGYRFEG